MAKLHYESLGHELHARGYLSMNKAVKWLKENHPEVAVSYPTMIKLVAQGGIQAFPIGGVTRIMKVELDRYVLHGARKSEE